LRKKLVPATRPHSKRKFRQLRRSLVERFGLGLMWDHVLERRVAKTSWFQGDGAALATLLGVQILTGITMALTYSNSVDHAYESVRYITHEQPLGWLVRALHYWSAGIMVVMLLFHSFRQLLIGGYKLPREGTWTIGVFLFFLVLTMSFTGYVLRWDERAVYAARVSLNMFHNVPWIGDDLVRLVQGGPGLGATTLTRFHGVHVLLVPFLLVGLVGWHLYLVVINGVTSLAERERRPATLEEQQEVYKQAAYSEEEGECFYPGTALKSIAFGLVVFSFAFMLALVLGPQDLYPEANLVERSFPIEEWWFWWYSSLIALLPSAVAPVFVWAFPLLLFTAMLLLPLIDRSPNRGIRQRQGWAVLVGVIVVGILVLSGLRLRSPWTGWPEPEPPPLPAGAVMTQEIQAGHRLFAVFGCNSCHAVAAHGRAVGPDLARIERRYSRTELRNYILAPPPEVPMPSYRGRMTEEELAQIVEFVLAAQTFPRE
jgi:ubiquinol-cytochrome c reductase cytochrome b subunit